MMSPQAHHRPRRRVKYTPAFALLCYEGTALLLSSATIRSRPGQGAKVKIAAIHSVAFWRKVYWMKRRILLVDDDVAVLLTFKAVLEISGFDVDTAASAREGKSRIRSREYHMIISDMRMESDVAGREVIHAARTAPYHPAIALLTAFPEDEVGWDGIGPDKILVKATQTRTLLQQIEKLFVSHSAKLSRLAAQASGAPASSSKEEAHPANKKLGTRAGKDSLLDIAANADEAPPAKKRSASSSSEIPAGAKKAIRKKQKTVSA
jgi:CheY-like chemotaxis protein